MAHDIPLLRQSHALATERDPDLASRFYSTLFAEHPEAMRLFRRNPKPEQQRMMDEALRAVLEHLDDSAWLEDALGTLGRRHVYYGVEPRMYGWFTDALLLTLREVMRSDWTDAHERAWLGALAEVTECMKRGARAG